MASKKRRMGAVFDHLCPLGFSKSLIRKKVNLLLKVYGDEGWVFFQEDAYKLLIEAILEEQEKLSVKDCSMEIGAASTSSQQPNQIAVIEHACIEPEPDKEPVSRSVVIEAESGGRRWEDLLASIFTKGLHPRDLEFLVPEVCYSWRRASRHPMCQRVIDGYHSDFAEIDLSYVSKCYMLVYWKVGVNMTKSLTFRKCRNSKKCVNLKIVRGFARVGDVSKNPVSSKSALKAVVKVGAEGGVVAPLETWIPNISNFTSQKNPVRCTGSRNQFVKSIW